MLRYREATALCGVSRLEVSEGGMAADRYVPGGAKYCVPQVLKVPTDLLPSVKVPRAKGRGAPPASSPLPASLLGPLCVDLKKAQGGTLSCFYALSPCPVFLTPNSWLGFYSFCKFQLDVHQQAYFEVLLHLAHSPYDNSQPPLLLNSFIVLSFPDLILVH